MHRLPGVDGCLSVADNTCFDINDVVSGADLPLHRSRKTLILSLIVFGMIEV